MHQQSRHPPRVSSPASSPQTNPTRTNNPRDRVRADSDTTSPDEKLENSESYGSMPSRDSIKKLDQIIQNFYAKAAVVIVQSRINTTPAGGRRAAEAKPNLWFSLETDEIEDFRDELRVYKQSGSFENRPPPMIIETYIDASRLSSNQSLVILDAHGKRWDVLEALNSSETSDDSPRQRHTRKRNTEVILERWRLELKCPSNLMTDEFGPTLPTVYKRSIVFFRSLFIVSRIMPCWKNFPSGLTKGINPALEVKCRVLSAETEYSTYDPLRQPLHDGGDAVTEYVFSDLEVPVGRFYASVTYRNDYNFRVDDAESLLSSQFMGVDENYFRPSLPQRRGHGRADSYAEPGSLPPQRQDRGPQGPQQTYGSLSTFHGAGALGTSPITAIRSVRPIGSDTSSPSASISGSVEQPDPPHSLPIRGTAARPMSRAYDGSGRRPSVSFQPFKAGSLSGSPRIGDLEAPSSPQSLNRPGIAGPSRTGNRSSLTMGSAASLRGAPPAPQDVPSTSGSPRPTGRYSSSFTHRRNRPSFGGQSKADDDQASSGKQSLSSSVQPGSGLLTEAGAVTSSGSFAADDDNISDFLKALDSRKTLKSFEPNKKGESLASKRTAAQLSKFQQMRETNNVLTESMTSSIHLQRSSSSSSRQLTNVPSMPLSPHTPHTPAIPSRLSENSIIDYQPQNQPRQGRNNPDTNTPSEGAEPVEEDDDETPMVTQQDSNNRTNHSSTTTTTTSTGTTAIDIPLSPRLLHHGGTAAIRRPNSVAHQQQHQHQQQQGHRSIAGEVDAYQRSASVEGVSADGRDVPTLSTLLAYHHEGAHIPRPDSSSIPPPSSSADADGGGGAPLTAGERGGGISSGLGMGLGRGLGRPGSLGRAGSGGRYAGSVEGADEEPLLFAMSELERDSRRSLDEQGGGAGGGGGGGGKYDPPRGIQKKGWRS
ncbi:autophagy-related protein 13-domain-containing protein [Chaetomium fimeti]|uniref:Autophagy-related protein 13 n=1 Tax=Chaetomium fimeti TaxID=1854472 RepID=A0AAE0H9V2_9PEZI|nr:autophagy-related protein 13-domain-containing protein [Chaetomium fimeti]